MKKISININIVLMIVAAVIVVAMLSIALFASEKAYAGTDENKQSRPDLSLQSNIEDRWGISAYDYRMEKTSGTHEGKVDLEDLIVNITERRAVEIEQELQPLSTRVEARNKKLDIVGNAFVQCSNIQAQLPNNFNPEDDLCDIFKKYVHERLDPESEVGKTGAIVFELNPELREELGRVETMGAFKTYSEKEISCLKLELDKLNNEAQSDMSRLQSIVNRRDASYETASSLMQSVASTRSEAIKNM